jgi:non-specific serine/threonine protein kinase
VVVLLGAAGCTGRSPGPSAPRTPSSAPPTVGGVGWKQLAPAPSKRTEVVAALAGNRVHVVGGFRADGATVTTVEVFDLATGQWAPGPDLPVAVNHAMATAVNGIAYVFGGHLADNRQSTRGFRLDGDGWHAIADLPEGRAAGTAVALDATVYLAGGVSGGALARKMLVYDVTADHWSTADGPPTAREHLGGAGYGGRLYTVGGRTGGLDTNLGAFEAFDPRTGRWSRLPDLPTPRGGLAATATCSGQVVAVGGEAAATFAQAEAYDVATGKWRALPPMPTARHGLGVVAAGTTVYTFAGGPQPGLHVADSAESVDLAALGACPASGPPRRTANILTLG